MRALALILLAGFLAACPRLDEGRPQIEPSPAPSASPSPVPSITPDPLGTVTSVTNVGCPSGGVSGSCRLLVVACPGVANQNVTLKTTSPTGTPVGTVIFGTGSGGNTFYDTQMTFGDTAIASVVQAGFTAVQIAFTPGNPTGWFNGPGGPRKLACRYATAAKWVHTNLHQGGATKPLCATGNSGGAALIAMAMSRYGMGSIFSMVQPTAGTPFSRLDRNCICNSPLIQTACKGGLQPECIANGEALIDAAYGSNICSVAQATHTTVNQAVFADDGPLGAGSILNFPTTDVHVVFSGQDVTNAEAAGIPWFNAITSKKTQDCVPGAPHAIPDDATGATLIANNLINYCRLQ